jgi:sec-independent protein translocase protein TatB
MLPSLGFQEIILLGIIALVVVGPKDLPLLLRKLGKWTAKLRGMAQEFRTGFDELARQAELDELRREVDALRRTTSIHNIGAELQKPLGTLETYASAPSPRYDTPSPESGPPAEPGPAPSGSQDGEGGADEARAQAAPATGARP